MAETDVLVEEKKPESQSEVKTESLSAIKVSPFSGTGWTETPPIMTPASLLLVVARITPDVELLCLPSTIL